LFVTQGSQGADHYLTGFRVFFHHGDKMWNSAGVADGRQSIHGTFPYPPVFIAQRFE